MRQCKMCIRFYYANSVKILIQDELYFKLKEGRRKNGNNSKTGQPGPLKVKDMAAPFL